MKDVSVGSGFFRPEHTVLARTFRYSYVYLISLTRTQKRKDENRNLSVYHYRKAIEPLLKCARLLLLAAHLSLGTQILDDRPRFATPFPTSNKQC